MAAANRVFSTPWPAVALAAFCGVLVIAFSPAVRANGGGYMFGYDHTGAIEALVKKGRVFVPAGTTHARILSEDLTINLLTESAEVEVRYRIRNDAAGRTVDIGFPVETGLDDELGELGIDSETAGPLPRYEISLDGKSVPASFVAEQPDAAKADERRKNISGWHVSRLWFKAKAEHELVIRYRAPYLQGGFFVSSYENGTVMAPEFRYRLSTGAVWEGPIEKGRITIRSLRPESAPFVIRKPEGKFKRAGDCWAWEFANLEPTMADDISVDVRPKIERHIGGYEFVEGRFYYSVPPDKVVASSTLKSDGHLTYEADHSDGSETWSEGVEGDGIGESLTYTFKKPHRLERIEINPGYAKSETLWQANGRVARLEITLNDEYKFEADLPDEYLRESCFSIPLKGYSEPVSKVKLKILGVHRGTKYSDTCISQVRFLTRLSKEPALQPVR